MPGVNLPGSADPWGGCWPGPGNTGVPAGVTLHSCAALITTPGTYDSCLFSSLDVRANGVIVTRSQINGPVTTRDGSPADSLLIRDSTINCACPSDATHTSVGVMQDGFTLERVDIAVPGHGVAAQDHVTIRDTWFHNIGNQTVSHKNGIYVGNGTGSTFDHNWVQCNDSVGCTAAIGLLVDFGPITGYSITHNYLADAGSYCLYGGGPSSKPYVSDHLTVTDNVFDQTIQHLCGTYGPVAYWWDSNGTNVFARNVWQDGTPVAKPTDSTA